MQPPVTTGGTNQNFIEPFDTINNGASTYPAKRAEIVADYINMGYHLVTIWTYPIEFDPISKKTNKQSLTHGENAWHDTATR